MSIYAESFEIIFGVKNNIQALRNKVLELAIQGKLVEQDPNDEPASDLVKRIQAEIQKLVKEGKIKKQKPLEPIDEGEIPFGIPRSWSYVRLGDTGDWGSGATPKRGVPEYWSNGTIPWLKTGELNNSYITNSEEMITEKALKESSLRFNKPGDVLIAMYGATIGKLGILNIEATTNQACCACTTYTGMYNEYLFYFLMANKRNFINSGEGGAQPNISKEKIVRFIIPLPPEKEQYRIVSKIESLMSKIDKLEETLRKKEQLTELLPKAVVDAMGKCQTGEELKEQLEFTIKNFETVFQTPGSMQKLKNMVLQLALEGKLVPQESSDEPASELIKRIQAERDILVKEGKIKKQKSLAPIEEDEIPFEIPKSWEWVRFGDVAFNYDGNRIPLSKAVRDKLDKIYDYYGASGVIDKVDKYIFDRPLLLIGEDGANLVTRTKPIAFIADGKYWVNNHAHVLDFIDSHLMEYVKNYICAIDLNPYVTGTAQPKMNQEKMNSILISIPPINEIKRINKQIESIMNLIDQMETELKRKVSLIEKMASM